MKTFLQILILMIVMVVMACGQNPTNTNSDPLKKYGNRRDDVPVKKRGQDVEINIPAKENDGEPKVCPKPYAIKITDASGNDVSHSLHFRVNQSTSYKISITSKTFQNLKPILQTERPQNMNLTPEKDGSYILSFKPSPDQDYLEKKLRLIIPLPKNDCINETGGELLTVYVNNGHERPSVVILNLDEETEHKIPEIIGFQVEVIDPSLTPAKTANFPEFTYKYSFGTDETAFTSAEKALSCRPGAKVNDTTYLFDCSIDTSKMPNPDPAHTITASTSFQVVSHSISGEYSDAEYARLLLKYPGEDPEPFVASDPKPAPQPAPPSKKSADKSALKNQKSGQPTSSVNSTSSKDQKSGDNT